jgi:hypothetical protein
MDYSFFLSYATADARNGKKAVEWFFETLNEELAIVHGAKKVGKGGFMAPCNIEPGENWSQDGLPKALNTTPVLVTLQSPSYFESEHCGREFEVFLQRRQQHVMLRRGDPPNCIIQVLWQPVYEAPATLPDFQWKQLDGTPFRAEAKGLYEAYISGQKDELTQFAHTLALRISNLLRQNVGANELAPLPGSPHIDGIPSAFAPPALPLRELEFLKLAGPTSATFVYPRTLNGTFTPFGPPLEKAAVSRAAAIARSREMSVQGIFFGPNDDWLRDRIETAQALNSPVVMMLTSESLAFSNVRDTCARIRPNGIAAVLLDGSPDAADVMSHGFVGSLRARNLFHANLGGADDLDKAIKISLGTLFNTLAQAGSLTISRTTAHTTLPQA